MRARFARKRAKGVAQRRRLFYEQDATILHPAIISSPGLHLSDYFVCAHYRLSSEEPKHADLCETAEAKAILVSQTVKPFTGSAMMNVTAVGEGYPNVDIREKE